MIAWLERALWDLGAERTRALVSGRELGYRGTLRKEATDVEMPAPSVVQTSGIVSGSLHKLQSRGVKDSRGAGWEGDGHLREARVSAGRGSIQVTLELCRDMTVTPGKEISNMTQRNMTVTLVCAALAVNVSTTSKKTTKKPSWLFFPHLNLCAVLEILALCLRAGVRQVIL